MHGRREHESLLFHACILSSYSNVPSCARHNLDIMNKRLEVRYQRRKAERERKRSEKLSKYDDYERVISMNALNDAADEAMKGVSWKASVQRYNMTRFLNIYRTHEKLKAGKDIRKGFICFDLIERGKLRHIKSVHFSERVVQKSICKNALYPILTNSLIYDNGASQKGKGTHFALNRLSVHVRRHIHRHGREGGILLIDFSDYFGNIDHAVLKDIYQKAFRDERLRNLGMSFIDAFGDKGLGLGSETSQINAVVLRNALDHYIKETLGIKGYGAYMDDSYLIHEDIGYLKECLKKIDAFCKRYGIALNKKKTKICDLKHGFTYLKTRFFITGTGHIIKKPCHQAITHERRKLKKQANLLCKGILTFKDIRISYASWRGSMVHRNAYRTIKSMDELFNRLFIDGWTINNEKQEVNNGSENRKRNSGNAGRDKRLQVTPKRQRLPVSKAC